MVVGGGGGEGESVTWKRLFEHIEKDLSRYLCVRPKYGNDQCVWFARVIEEYM